MGVEEPLRALELLVGRVVHAAEHPGARAPSYLLQLDFGPRGTREASVERGDYEPGDLEGTQIACAVRGDEVLVLAARSHAGGIALLRPDREVEDGTAVA